MGVNVVETAWDCCAGRRAVKPRLLAISPVIIHRALAGPGRCIPAGSRHRAPSPWLFHAPRHAATPTPPTARPDEAKPTVAAAAMPPTDEDAATAAIAALETLSRDQRVALDAIHAILRDGQPFVDIHDLFGHYNVLYFRGLLVPRVDVSWSPRLTLYVPSVPRDPGTQVALQTATGVRLT